MDQHFTYVADLGGVTLSDGSDATWVHALPLGEYKHPIHGKLSFTPDRIKRFVASVKSKVLGVDPDIDYDHKMDSTKGRKAAGWVKDAEERSNGLWLLVEWTKPAREAIANKEYRYFSAEYVDEMEGPDGSKMTDVVRGGGLTNRPFMKNLVPINLSELDAEVDTDKENEMDRKKLAKLLGLSEDATDEQIESAIQSKDKKLDLTKAEVTVGEDGTIEVKHPEAEGVITHKVEAPKPPENQGNPEEVTEEAIAELAKTNPAAAAVLSETLESSKKLSEEVKTLVATQRLNDVSVQLSEVGSGERKALAPSVRSKLAPILVRLPKQLSDELIDAIGDLAKDTGVVKLGEVASGGDPNNGGGEPTDPVKKFTDLVEAKQAENKELAYRDAVALAESEDPALFKAYRSAVADGVTLTD